jgi:hypothetical protein
MLKTNEIFNLCQILSLTYITLLKFGGQKEENLHKPTSSAVILDVILLSDS